MINFACRHYKGSKPCAFNKQDGSECPSCKHVSEFKERILFIKLDAIGDVLRSASLLPAIIGRHQMPYIAWLTRKESAELVSMMKYVDEVIELSEVGVARIMTGGWDWIYSLSNDLPSASLAAAARGGTRPIGYYVEQGVIKPSNRAAGEWLEMAAFDRLKRENKDTYQRRMLSILGADDAPIPAPALQLDTDQSALAAARVLSLFPGSRRQRIAINVGAGGRWPKKMLNAEQIYHYIQRLSDRIDIDILLVGGSAEEQKANAIISLCDGDDRVRTALTGSSIADFVAILSEVDVLLCGDTLALHIATAIGLPTVAVFGPTSPSEIADFDGLVVKAWTDQLDCLVCYGDCTKQHNCMSLLDLEHLVALTQSQLARTHATRPATALYSSIR
jgi:ADP-heptose:LPS heptosyltransferase